MNLYCLNILKKSDNTAGSKAPADCFKISTMIGGKEIIFYQPKFVINRTITRFFAFFTGISNWNRLYKSVEPESYVILQHPKEGIVVANKYIDYCKRKKKIKFIALVHDLDSLRNNIINKSKMMKQRNEKADETLLHKCDFIICHNESMMNYLISHGFSKETLVSLEIFDYLCDKEQLYIRKKEKSVAIAGNLLESKCEYLYKIIGKKDLDFILNLYGPNYSEKTRNSLVVYHGQYSPDELPSKLEGAFGLVWDGTEIETCSGNAGEYLRYNNPHKCSLFLAADMPVIIWKEAALAKFVEKYQVGICVNSINEIGKEIDKITDEEYAEMLRNVQKIGSQIRSGYFLKKALGKIYR